MAIDTHFQSFLINNLCALISEPLAECLHRQKDSGRRRLAVMPRDWLIISSRGSLVVSFVFHMHSSRCNSKRYKSDYIFYCLALRLTAGSARDLNEHLQCFVVNFNLKRGDFFFFVIVNITWAQVVGCASRWFDIWIFSIPSNEKQARESLLERWAGKFVCFEVESTLESGFIRGQGRLGCKSEVNEVVLGMTEEEEESWLADHLVMTTTRPEG